MSRTISQLDVGTSVYIEENGTAKEYVLLKKDESGCIVLRANAYEARRMNATNVTNYEDSEMDQWLLDETNGFMSLFDSATKAAIVSRSRPTFDYGDTECRYISRRAFLLTYGEMFLSTPTALEPNTGLTAPLMIWKGTSGTDAARIAKNEAGQAVNWWESSPYSSANFYYVNSSGTSSHNSASSSSSWARPALNVASATIVSDEGASTIYLLPSGGSRAVSFEGSVVESVRRPMRVSVEYNAVGLSNVDVKVCNNYGDSTPTWESVTSGQDKTLTNTTKQTENWKLGIKCYGESQGYGYFNEPIVKLEVE